MAGKIYKDLDITDKVRVNAVIISAFQNDPNQFIKNFREQSIANATNGDRMVGFQATLDNLRDALTKEIKHLPKVTSNGIADQNDWNEQKTLLRNLQAYMNDETKNRVYSSQQIKDTVDRMHKSAKLPDIVKPYAEISEALVKSAALAACKGLAPLQCVTTNSVGATQAPDINIAQGHQTR